MPKKKKQAYAEVVEYVRAGVQLIHDELIELRVARATAGRPDPSPPELIHLTDRSMRKDEFARRRRQLMKMMGKGGIAILPAVPEKARNGDVHYHYRPDSDFYYLTGFAEPEAVAVLIPGRRAGRVRAVRARARSGARDLGRTARRARGRDARLRRRRRVPDRRHRRHPARA